MIPHPYPSWTTSFQDMSALSAGFTSPVRLVLDLEWGFLYQPPELCQPLGGACPEPFAPCRWEVESSPPPSSSSVSSSESRGSRNSSSILSLTWEVIFSLVFLKLCSTELVFACSPKNTVEVEPPFSKGRKVNGIYICVSLHNVRAVKCLFLKLEIKNYRLKWIITSLFCFFLFTSW